MNNIPEQSAAFFDAISYTGFLLVVLPCSLTVGRILIKALSFFDKSSSSSFAYNNLFRFAAVPFYAEFIASYEVLYFAAGRTPSA